MYSLQQIADFVELHGFPCIVNNLEECVNFQIPWTEANGSDGYECVAVSNMCQARIELGY